MQVEDLDGNVLRTGLDLEKDKPLDVWMDADGIRWRHLGNQSTDVRIDSSSPKKHGSVAPPAAGGQRTGLGMARDYNF